jgi:hypothetical protein
LHRRELGAQPRIHSKACPSLHLVFRRFESALPPPDVIDHPWGVIRLHLGSESIDIKVGNYGDA